MTMRIKRFFHAIAMDALRLAVYAVIALGAIFTALFILSIPEIIGMMMFG